MAIAPDTKWTDDEIVFSDMTPDTLFVFDRMTVETLRAVDARPGEKVLDVACGRSIDAFSMAKSGADIYGVEASDTMLEKSREYLGANADKVTLARALAENLPYADNSFDKVVCKGAMDHFADIEKSMAEMARVTKPDGVVIIAIANFESLTCRLGRTLWKVKTRLTGQKPPEHPFWEPPLDHNYKFDLEVLTRLLATHGQIQSVVGMSLLWGFPNFGAFLRKLPKPLTNGLLKTLDAGARLMPGLSDVLVARAKPMKH